MVTNEYLSLLRRKSVPTISLTYEALDGPRAPAESDASARFVERADLWQRVMALPRQHRAVIVLRYYEGLSDSEIAETLHCRPGTVRGYMTRALAALRIDLTEPATNTERIGT
jgi:RNA polymerase sigma factor (sigma-70 family)